MKKTIITIITAATVALLAGCQTDNSNQPDYSLFGYLTKEESREATRAYYRARTPENLAREKKLNALAEATREDGSVDHELYMELSR